MNRSARRRERRGGGRVNGSGTQGGPEFGPETPERQQREDDPELGVLFPFETVTLHDGSKVIVREWSIETGFSATPIVVSLLRRLSEVGASGQVETDALVRMAGPECRTLLCITLGWEPEELERRCTFTDFLDLVAVMFRVCLVREDGRGAFPKILELVGASRGLVRGGIRATSSPSQPPSTS